MTRRARLLLGAAVVVAALAFLVVTGIQQSVVYFVTPSELMAAQAEGADRSYRLGGMVVQGSLTRDDATREQRFLLTDGKVSVPVYHQGIPPDLFGEGRGAVVEGRLGPDGTFRASTIMAKHSEEYRAPEGTMPPHQELLRTLQGGATASGTR